MSTPGFDAAVDQALSLLSDTTGPCDAVTTTISSLTPSHLHRIREELKNTNYHVNSANIVPTLMHVDGQTLDWFQNKLNEVFVHAALEETVWGRITAKVPMGD